MTLLEAQRKIVDCWLRKFPVNNPLHPIPLYRLDQTSQIRDHANVLYGYTPPSDAVWCDLLIQGGIGVDKTVGGTPKSIGGSGTTRRYGGVLKIKCYFPTEFNSVQIRLSLSDHIDNIYEHFRVTDLWFVTSDYLEIGKTTLAGMNNIFYETSNTYVFERYHDI